jgi:DNA-binding transcriptional regulator PaaX
MGELEIKNKKEIRSTEMQKVVLQTIKAAGVLSIALLAPNALRMFKIFKTDKKSIRNKEHSIQASRKRLVEKGLVKYNENGLLVLTSLGQRQLEKIERLNFKVRKPTKWDGKWRVLIFDIKESKKLIRDKIRVTLNNIGFIKLQNSVWIYPYDCEDLITLLKADFQLGREVLYMIVDKLENDKFIRNRFGL